MHRDYYGARRQFQIVGLKLKESGRLATGLQLRTNERISISFLLRHGLKLIIYYYCRWRTLYSESDGMCFIYSIMQPLVDAVTNIFMILNKMA